MSFGPKDSGDKVSRYAGDRDRPGRRPSRPSRVAPDHGGERDAAPRVARKPDSDAAPAGWDQRVWDLAGLFLEIGQSYGHAVSARRPLVYSLLEDALAKHRVVRAKGKPVGKAVGEMISWPSRLADDTLAKEQVEGRPFWDYAVSWMIRDWWDLEHDPDHPSSAANDFVSLPAWEQEWRMFVRSHKQAFRDQEFAKYKRGEPNRLEGQAVHDWAMPSAEQRAANRAAFESRQDWLNIMRNGNRLMEEFRESKGPDYRPPRDIEPLGPRPPREERD